MDSIQAWQAYDPLTKNSSEQKIVLIVMMETGGLTGRGQGEREKYVKRELLVYFFHQQDFPSRDVIVFSK